MDIEKINQILEDHERRISKLEGTKHSIHDEKEIDSMKALTDLLESSFFNQNRTRGQIIKQLKTNATFSTEGNYKKSLEILVREKKLTRKTVSHQWVYFKDG